MRVGVLVRMGVICGHNITKNSNDLRASLMVGFFFGG